MASLTGKSIRKLFLHDKPFMLLQAINDSNGRVYAAMVSKKIDCSYAYIVKLIKLMNSLGLLIVDDSNHKKTVMITQKGKKLLKLISEIK